MTLYWLMYLVPIIAIFSNFDIKSSKLQIFLWALFGFYLFFIIGFRHEIGGDWDVYLFIFNDIAGQPLVWAWDPGYEVLNYILAKLGFGIYSVNAVCTLICIFGLMRFCFKQPLPWLAIAVSVPTILIVVYMGYTRQATALGFLFLGLSFLHEGRWKIFLFNIFVGCLFHKTLILTLPILVLGQNTLTLKNWLIISTFIFSIGLLFIDDFLKLYNMYIVRSWAVESSGAIPRLFLHSIATFTLLFNWSKWKAYYGNNGPWLGFALISVIALILVLFIPTAIDRLAVYLLPLQVVVWSGLPPLISTSLYRTLLIISILTLYGLVMFVWLNFANHSFYWVPYDNLFFS